MFPNMLVFNALRDSTATLYNAKRGCCVFILCMEMFTRDHPYDHKDI